MGEASGDGSAKPVALKDQIEELTAALQAFARAEGDEALKAAGETVRRLAGQATRLVEDMAGPGEDVEAAARRGLTRLEAAIREQPLAAVGLAAAAGVLLALLVRR
jgi:ElaB/YqjD/DUF883 family membrane-anchored ribosome-binding protein